MFDFLDRIRFIEWGLWLVLLAKCGAFAYLMYYTFWSAQCQLTPHEKYVGGIILVWVYVIYPTYTSSK